MRHSDFLHHGTWVGFQKREPFSIFRNFTLNMNYWLYWNLEGELLSTDFNTNLHTQFKNKWRFSASLNRTTESLSMNMLWGGPSFIKPGENSFELME